MSRIIWWIKRDFRLSDNAALSAACASAEEVLPVYIYEDSVIIGPDWSRFHSVAVESALSSLARALQPYGVPILRLRGEAAEVFDRLQHLLPFTAIHAHEETGLRHTYARDNAVRSWARSRGVAFREFPTNGVIRGLKDRDDRMGIWKERMAVAPLPVPQLRAPGEEVARLLRADRLPAPLIPTAPGLRYEGLRAIRILDEAPGDNAREGLSAEDAPGCLVSPTDGERCQSVSLEAATETLDSFFAERGIGYSGGISSMNSAPQSGSRLSVHLAWGTLSLRQVIHRLTAADEQWRGLSTDEARRWKRSLRAFRSRLMWHDHFIQRLEDDPELESEPINRAFADLEFDGTPELLDAWIRGQTGWPLVDASIRCFNHTGFLNFRSRAMIVSAGVHALHLDWRSILYPMARMMADYLPGIHVSQLQMQAGVTGINTLRIYSPMKQLRDHDPDCVFVRRWVPELADRDPAEIHAAEQLPLGSYPRPLVDLGTATSEFRRRVYAVKRSSDGKQESARVLSQHGSRRPARARR